MLGKLMKYEFMATGRVFLPLFAALIIISTVSRILSSFQLQTPSIIGVVVAVILIVGIFVLTFIITIQRFRQNLLSEEGYLMMTLPVKTDSHIFSKLFVSTVWAVASFVIVVIAIMIMAMTGYNFSDLARAIKEFFSTVALEAPQVIVYAIEALVFIILSIFSSILLLYTCISLSMLVSKRRGLFSFGAFIVITVALQVIGSIFVAIGAAITLPGGIDRLFSRMSVFGTSQVLIAVVVLTELILCAIYYLVTRHMLKNRLNLQ